MKRTISELTIRLLVVEEDSPPSYDADTTAEAMPDEVSRVLTVARPSLRKCSGQVLSFEQRKRVAR
jgi:hypothetical protein